MGILMSRLFSSLFGEKEARILVLGLDNAGKTTILYRLQVGEVVSPIPSACGRSRGGVKARTPQKEARGCSLGAQGRRVRAVPRALLGASRAAA